MSHSLTELFQVYLQTNRQPSRSYNLWLFRQLNIFAIFRRPTGHASKEGWFEPKAQGDHQLRPRHGLHEGRTFGNKQSPVVFIAKVSIPNFLNNRTLNCYDLAVKFIMIKMNNTIFTAVWLYQ